MTKILGKQAHVVSNTQLLCTQHKTYFALYTARLYITHSQLQLKSRAPLNRFAQHCLTLIIQIVKTDV